jgi:ubiquinone biosynthesis protein UbiJ
VLTQAHISGSAELAEALGFVLRNIRWDIESDLARLVGDIAAHRLVKGGKSLAAWQLGQARNLALNLAEFYTEEDPLIARRSEVSAFCGAVPEVQAELLRLERRIAALEGRKHPRQD